MGQYVNRISCILFVAFFFSWHPAVAQKTGEITGVVLNNETQEVLPGAHVQINGTFLGDVCDENGQFELSNLKPDIYWLKVSFIGFASNEFRVDLTEEQKVDLTVALLPSPIKMDQIIVTGSRQREELSAAAASVSVLDAREIRSRNQYQIDDALRYVPGVNIVGENVNIRGGSGYNRLGGSRILVLLDNVPVLTSDLGSANWNIIPITSVDRIEVLKGAASSLYGSGALSGVVNIITKNPSEKDNITYRQSAGIYDDPSVPQWKWTDKTLYYHRTDAGLSHQFDRLGLRLDVAHHYSTGDREMGAFNRWYVTGKANWRFPDHSNLTAFLTYSYDDRDLFLRWLRQNKALQVPPSDRNNHYRLQSMFGYAMYEKLFSPTLSAKARVSYNQQLVGLPFDLTSAFKPALGFSGEIQTNWLPHPDHSISMGVDYKHDRVESIYYGERRANGISPYIQEIWKISQIWQMNLGLRYDTYTLVGDSIETQLSPRIGFSYHPWHGTIVHFSFGRGFRAASVVERFLSVDEGGDVEVVPNPKLKPERSRLFDIGVRQSFGGHFFAEVSGFSSVYQNLIELTFDPRRLNVRYLSYPKAKIQGIETAVRWKFWQDRIGLDASAIWMKSQYIESKDVSSVRTIHEGEPLPYRPRFIAHVTPKFQFGNFKVEADFRYASKIQKVLVYPRDERVPTKVWNLRIGYKWHDVTVQFLVNNAVNYNYTISERVLGTIRSFAISIGGEI